MSELTKTKKKISFLQKKNNSFASRARTGQVLGLFAISLELCQPQLIDITT